MQPYACQSILPPSTRVNLKGLESIQCLLRQVEMLLLKTIGLLPNPFKKLFYQKIIEIFYLLTTNLLHYLLQLHFENTNCMIAAFIT